MSSLTHARVLRLFDYDAATGNLTWKISESNRIKVGAVAGAVAANGRRYIGVDGERQLAHRLVWFHQKAEWPSENLAPANGDYLDTRIANLIEQTAQETVAKGRLRSTNTSGVKGVWFDKARGKWAVQTVSNYRTKFHGRFDTLEEAEVALAAVQTSEASGPVGGEKKKESMKHRRMWNAMLRNCKGDHEWPSISDFIADVGEPPKANFYVAPVDSSRLLGPDNFVWSAPQYDHQTRDGRMASSRSYRDSDPAKYRDKDLRRNFGISLADYETMSEEQGGVCAICSQPETALRRNRLLPLSVDHNHRTGALRGLLCTACNIGIGSLAESRERLTAAIAYLEKWEARETAPLADNVVRLKDR